MQKSDTKPYDPMNENLAASPSHASILRNNNSAALNDDEGELCDKQKVEEMHLHHPGVVVQKHAMVHKVLKQQVFRNSEKHLKKLNSQV